MLGGLCTGIGRPNKEKNVYTLRGSTFGGLWTDMDKPFHAIYNTSLD